MVHKSDSGAHNHDADLDRKLQVLTLEYGTLREEILMRLSARYQFIGFVTAATALIGVAIGYSSGFKVWLLIVLAAAVLFLGFYGYYRMVINGKILSVRIAKIEDRINELVPAEPGNPKLLSWELEHQNQSPIWSRALGRISRILNVRTRK
jgi:sulfite exporter TauE/SafE